MKIQLLSDIHLEYYDKYPGLNYFIEPKSPILVLGGDICYYKHKHFIPFFREASMSFEYIVFVPGNHEYYMKSYVDMNFDTFESVDIEMKKKLTIFKNVYFLQKDTVIINNIKFIGATLWYETFDKNQLNKGESNNFYAKLSENLRKFIKDNITIDSIYELFPYSSPKYDPDKALIDIQESTYNLNTRLSNLKKINKSLIRFQENSSSLNWEELQKISSELEDDYKDN